MIDTAASATDATLAPSPARAAMRVVHVFAPAPFGGLERVVHALALLQSRAGHGVTVVGVIGAGADEHPLLRDLRKAGVAVHVLRLPSRAYMRERRLVSEVCRSVRPDVLHTHGYRADVLHGSVANRLGITSVTTVHGFTGGGWKNRFYERLQQRAYRRFSAVVAVSRPLRDQLTDGDVAAERVHLVPNAWLDEAMFYERAEARERLGLELDRRWAGFVGRLGKEKGPDTFVEGLALHAGGAVGVVMGDGPMRQPMEARAAEILAGDGIRWLGVVPEAARYMKALDVFILSSRTEGTPIALFEAIAAGVPVVATAVGGVPDVVGENEAVIVPSEDPVALAAAVDAVLSDPVAARARARRARERLRSEFDAQSWLDRYDDVYRKSGATAAGGE